MPQETARTKGASYSMYNLEARLGSGLGFLFPSSDVFVHAGVYTRGSPSFIQQPQFVELPGARQPIPSTGIGLLVALCYRCCRLAILVGLRCTASLHML